MQIGDLVRVISGTEEGKIIRIIDEKVIEIETTDGFAIPVMKSEIVVVASEEKNYFDKEEVIDEIKPKASSSLFEDGVYLAFEFEEGKNKAECYFINNSPYTYTLAVSEVKAKNTFKNKLTQVVRKKDAVKIDNFNLQAFDQWNELIFHLTEIKNNDEAPGFIKKSFTPKAKNFFKSKTKSPLRNQTAYVFNLLQGSLKVDAEEIKEKLFTGEAEVAPNPFSNDPIEVDLHIEELREDHEFLSPEEILPIQLAEFDKHLDEALVKNRPEITFIHGIGSGKLKYEISKVLSKHPHVKYFEDANKTRFGYGATKAVLK